jgi:hypothetical protein
MKWKNVEEGSLTRIKIDPARKGKGRGNRNYDLQYVRTVRL